MAVSHALAAPAGGVFRVARSVALCPDRRVTRTLARYYFDLAQRPDHGHWAGLRYLSRLDGAWECFALWPDPLRRNTITVRPASRTDPALRAAAARLHISL